MSALIYQNSPVCLEYLTSIADFERLLAVLGFDDLEVEAFQDAPCDFPDDG
jgi:hypothetical protein